MATSQIDFPCNLLQPNIYFCIQYSRSTLQKIWCEEPTHDVNEHSSSKQVYFKITLLWKHYVRRCTLTANSQQSYYVLKLNIPKNAVYHWVSVCVYFVNVVGIYSSGKSHVLRLGAPFKPLLEKIPTLGWQGKVHLFFQCIYPVKNSKQFFLEEMYSSLLRRTSCPNNNLRFETR